MDLRSIARSGHQALFGSVRKTLGTLTLAGLVTFASGVETNSYLSTIFAPPWSMRAEFKRTFGFRLEGIDKDIDRLMPDIAEAVAIARSERTIDPNAIRIIPSDPAARSVRDHLDQLRNFDGLYNRTTNVLLLSPRASPSTIVHELGHVTIETALARDTSITSRWLPLALDTHGVSLYKSPLGQFEEYFSEHPKDVFSKTDYRLGFVTTHARTNRAEDMAEIIEHAVADPDAFLPAFTKPLNTRIIGKIEQAIENTWVSPELVSFITLHKLAASAYTERRKLLSAEASFAPTPAMDAYLHASENYLHSYRDNWRAADVHLERAEMLRGIAIIKWGHALSCASGLDDYRAVRTLPIKPHIAYRTALARTMQCYEQLGEKEHARLFRLATARYDREREHKPRIVYTGVEKWLRSEEDRLFPVDPVLWHMP